MVVQEAVQTNYCSNKASQTIRKQRRKHQKVSLTSLVIVVIFFLVSVDQLLRSFQNSCSKDRSRAVMLLGGVLNNQGTRPNPQDQRSVTINKLLFDSGFNVCCCQGEYSSATPLFRIDRLAVVWPIPVSPCLFTYVRIDSPK